MIREIRNLDELMDGAVNERFNNELHKILDNVYDLNTDPKKPRKLVFSLTIKPFSDRSGASFLVDVKPTLAPPLPLEQTVMLDRRDDGSIVASERSNQLPGQLDIDGEENIPNVIQFNNTQGGK